MRPSTDGRLLLAVRKLTTLDQADSELLVALCLSKLTSSLLPDDTQLICCACRSRRFRQPKSSSQRCVIYRISVSSCTAFAVVLRSRQLTQEICIWSARLQDPLKTFGSIFWMQRAIRTLVMSFQYPIPPNLPDPFLPAATGVHNIRHLGGYALNAPSAIGHLPSYCIEPHIIFRSAEPSRITPEGIALLEKYNVKTVFDLRAKSETEKNEAMTPVKTWDGVKRISVPCGENDEAGPERMAEKSKVYMEDGSKVRRETQPP